MSKIEDRKAQAEYETDIPRCGNCSWMVRKDNRTPKGRPIKLCGLNSWAVQENSVCKHWKSSTGETLA